MPKIINNNKRVLKGSMRAYRVISNNEPDYMQIEIIDDLSRLFIYSIKMSLKEYANLVTLHKADAEISIWNDTPIGKRYEHKQEVVPFAYEIGKEEEYREKAQEALKPFEVDGWKGDITNMFMSRKYKHIPPMGGQVVTFTRYVDVEENE